MMLGYIAFAACGKLFSRNGFRVWESFPFFCTENVAASGLRSFSQFPSQ
jgi:hypothetical protein